MKALFSRIIDFFNARDVFVFIGFGFLYYGIAREYNLNIASIVIGAIIILKGLTKWAG